MLLHLSDIGHQLDFGETGAIYGSFRTLDLTLVEHGGMQLAMDTVLRKWAQSFIRFSSRRPIISSFERSIDLWLRTCFNTLTIVIRVLWCKGDIIFSDDLVGSAISHPLQRICPLATQEIRLICISNTFATLQSHSFGCSVVSNHYLCHVFRSQFFNFYKLFKNLIKGSVNSF